MRIKKINDNWKFWEDKDSFALSWDIPGDAQAVTLPHDAMLMKPANPDSPNGGNTGYRDGGIYSYAKLMDISEEDRQKTLMIKIEGAYNNALVYINGQLAAKRPFGYTPFYVELNNYVNYGATNEIRVQVRAGAMTNSRYYSGAGLYRDVYYLESGLCYIAPDGVKIRTKDAEADYAALDIQTEIMNRSAAPERLVLETRIRDAKGHVVSGEKTRVVMYGNDSRKIPQQVVVQNPECWSDESPVLYTCETMLYDENNQAIDENTEYFGIRTITVDAKRGLRVNGKMVKLRGACVHHDSGFLGAATYEEIHYRQVKKLKEAGFNAIRMSHQPMAPAMLKVCDQLGMYVMDEGFDMWNRPKSDYDFGLNFMEWWESEIEAMVQKDYNHPSVIMYSIGNEIPEIGSVQGAKLCADICAKIKSLDDTRFTLASINGIFSAGDCIGEIMADVTASLAAQGKIEGNVNNFMALMDGHLDEIVTHRAISQKLEMACAYTDIAGYNYMTARYEPDGKDYPNRVIVGSETYPPEIARNWPLVKKLDHVIGDFTWTGWDYVGEAGIGVPCYSWGEGGFGATFPTQLAYCGDFDLTGYRRPASYFREIVYGMRKDPYIAVQDPHHFGEFLIKTPWIISDAISSWTWRDCLGKPVVVEVYAPGTEVELINNGVSVGRKPSGETAGFCILFETVYQGGSLLAVAYDGEIEIGRYTLYEASKERHLEIKPETGYDYGNKEWKYVDVEICDEKGVVAADEDVKLTLTVSGGAGVEAFGSGNPKPLYDFNEGVTETYHGRAVIILRKNDRDEPVKIKVQAENHMSAECEMNM